MHAFSDLLDDSPAPVVVVTVSSGVGSLGYAGDPAGPAADGMLLGHPSSKAAVNMLTVKWARAHPRWQVNAGDPGFTATDLDAHRGNQTVHEGTEASVRLACVAPDRPTGTVVDRHGTVPW